jgi:hypothetical protein
MEEKKSGQASRIYGLDFAVHCARNPAKLVEFTDWIYGQAIAHCFFHCKYVCDTVYTCQLALPHMMGWNNEKRPKR